MTTKYPYLVVATAYHGGGIVSRHTTRELAEAAAKKWRLSDCTCGCCGVIMAKEYDALPRHGEAGSPYKLVR